MKTIKEYTDIELKAIAYDKLAIIEQHQADLKAINLELQARAEAIRTKEEEPKKK